MIHEEEMFADIEKVERLERRVERLEALLSTPGRKKPQLPSPEEETILKAVAGSRSLQDAASELSISVTNLKRSLADVPHLHGEKWSIAAQRRLDKEDDVLVDTYNYEKIEAKDIGKIIRLLRHEGATFQELLEKLKVPRAVFSRWLWKNGYSTKGEFIGYPTWEIINEPMELTE